jgi:hypothetical protein
MPTKLDLIGRRFNRLVVLRKAESQQGHGVYWECRCDCGGLKRVRTGHLRKGAVQSCGCLRHNSSSLFKVIIPSRHLPSVCEIFYHTQQFLIFGENYGTETS